MGVGDRQADFGRDFHVTFSGDEIAAGRADYNFTTVAPDGSSGIQEFPGISVFYRDEAGQVFHTYSTYARGLDAVLTTNHYLDLHARRPRRPRCQTPELAAASRMSTARPLRAGTGEGSARDGERAAPHDLVAGLGGDQVCFLAGHRKPT